MAVSTPLPSEGFAPISPEVPDVAPPPRGPAYRFAVAAWAWLCHGRVPLLGLLAVSVGLRAFRLSEVVGSLIGDEVWYVQAARVLIGLPVVPHHLPSHALSGIDPNSEHPPLAKLIMAGFMRLLGDREIAWRIPSIVMGVLAIALVHEIVLRLQGTRRQALLAAFILSFDNLSFIHGRIAMLDVYLTAFMLLGVWLYLGGRPALAGVAFALATLCKMNGLLGLVAVLFAEAILAWRGRRPFAAGPQAEMLGFFAAFFVLGLGALDCYWTEYHGPFDQLAHMVSYHASLKHEPLGSGASDSTPMQWWLNQGGMPYFEWSTTWNGQTQKILFMAEMNDYLVFAAPFALLYAGQRAWAASSSLAALAVAWVAANHLPVVLAWAVFSRTSYIYYMVPVIPGMAWALAVLLADLPRAMRWCFAAAMLFAFIVGFPFKYF